MDTDRSFVLLDSFSSLQPSVECLDSFDSLDLPESGDQARRSAAESVSIEIMDSFSSANTSFLGSGGIMDDNCCNLNADSDLQNADKSSNYLQVTSTPRKELQPLMVELNETPWSRTAATNTKRIKYMEGSQINTNPIWLIHVLFN
jgi:hypothetical protein